MGLRLKVEVSTCPLCQPCLWKLRDPHPLIHLEDSLMHYMRGGESHGWSQTRAGDLLCWNYFECAHVLSSQLPAQGSGNSTLHSQSSPLEHRCVYLENKPTCGFTHTDHGQACVYMWLSLVAQTADWLPCMHMSVFVEMHGGGRGKAGSSVWRGDFKSHPLAFLLWSPGWGVMYHWGL